MTNRREFLIGLSATIVVVDDPFAMAVEAPPPAAPMPAESVMVRVVSEFDPPGEGMTLDLVRKAVAFLKKNQIQSFDFVQVTAGDLVPGEYYAVTYTPDGFVLIDNPDPRHGWRLEAVEQHCRCVMLSNPEPKPRRIPGATPPHIRTARKSR